jgi:hypothetical protein
MKVLVLFTKSPHFMDKVDKKITNALLRLNKIMGATGKLDIIVIHSTDFGLENKPESLGFESGW